MREHRGLWTNFLCLATIGISGLLSVHSLRLHDFLTVEKLSSNPETAFFLPMQITNRVFTDALLNPASEEYQTMYRDVSELLENIYNCSNVSTCPTDAFYKGVARMTFSSGSVIANATVVFNTSQINRSIIHIYFLLNGKRTHPKTLQLNMDYTTKDKVIQTAVPPPTTATTTTTKLTTTTTTTQPLTTTTTTTTQPPTTATAQHPATNITTTTQPPTTTTTTTTQSPTTTTTTTTTILMTQRITTPTTTTKATSTKDPTTTPTTPTAVKPTTTTTIDHTTTTTATTTLNTSTTTPPTKSTTTAPMTTITTTPTTTMTRANRHNKHADFRSVSAGEPLAPSGSRSSSAWVPGWAVALLVLTSAILLLLIIIFIMMLVCWCCQKIQSNHLDAAEDPYYTEKKQLPQDPLPVYSTLPPPVSTPVINGDPPKKKWTGFYGVNP